MRRKAESYGVQEPPLIIELDEDVEWIKNIWQELCEKGEYFLSDEEFEARFHNAVHVELSSPQYIYTDHQRGIQVTAERCPGPGYRLRLWRVPNYE